MGTNCRICKLHCPRFTCTSYIAFAWMLFRSRLELILLGIISVYRARMVGFLWAKSDAVRHFFGCSEGMQVFAKRKPLKPMEVFLQLWGAKENYRESTKNTENYSYCGGPKRPLTRRHRWIQDAMPELWDPLALKENRLTELWELPGTPRICQYQKGDKSE